MGWDASLVSMKPSMRHPCQVSVVPPPSEIPSGDVLTSEIPSGDVLTSEIPSGDVLIARYRAPELIAMQSIYSYYARDFIDCNCRYRAPELLCRTTDYGGAVDTWAAGCICFEVPACRS